MKITKQRLKTIIKEEMKKIIDERIDVDDPMLAKIVSVEPETSMKQPVAGGRSKSHTYYLVKYDNGHEGMVGLHFKTKEPQMLGDVVDVGGKKKLKYRKNDPTKQYFLDKIAAFMAGQMVGGEYDPNF